MTIAVDWDVKQLIKHKSASRDCKCLTRPLLLIIMYGVTRPLLSIIMYGETRPLLSIIMHGVTRPLLSIIMNGVTRPLLSITFTLNNTLSPTGSAITLTCRLWLVACWECPPWNPFWNPFYM